MSERHESTEPAVERLHVDLAECLGQRLIRHARGLDIEHLCVLLLPALGRSVDERGSRFGGLGPGSPRQGPPAIACRFGVIPTSSKAPR